MKSQGEAAKVSLRLFAAWRLCVIIVFQPVDDSRDAVLDQRHVEVDQQAKPLVSKPEIRQKLLFVDWSKQFDRFDFHDDLVFHHQIGPEPGIDADTVIDHRNRLLAHRTETPPTQLIRQDRLINRFQLARTKCRMNAESGIDDLLRNGVPGHRSLSFSLAKSPRRKERNCCLRTG